MSSSDSLAIFIATISWVWLITIFHIWWFLLGYRLFIVCYSMGLCLVCHYGTIFGVVYFRINYFGDLFVVLFLPNVWLVQFRLSLRVHFRTFITSKTLSASKKMKNINFSPKSLQTTCMTGQVMVMPTRSVVRFSVNARADWSSSIRIRMGGPWCVILDKNMPGWMGCVVSVSLLQVSRVVCAKKKDMISSSLEHIATSIKLPT